MEVKRILNSFKRVEYKADMMNGNIPQFNLAIKKNKLKSLKKFDKPITKIIRDRENRMTIIRNKPKKQQTNKTKLISDRVNKELEENRKKAYELRTELLLNHLNDLVNYKKRIFGFIFFSKIQSLKKLSDVLNVVVLKKAMRNIKTNVCNNKNRVSYVKAVVSESTNEFIKLELECNRLKQSRTLTKTTKEDKHNFIIKEEDPLFIEYLSNNKTKNYEKAYYNFNLLKKAFKQFKSFSVKTKNKNQYYIEKEIDKFNKEIKRTKKEVKEKQTKKTKISTLDKIKNRTEKRKEKMIEIKKKQMERIKQKKLKEQKKLENKRLEEEEELNRIRKEAQQKKEELRKFNENKKRRVQLIKNFRRKQLKRNLISVLKKNVEYKKDCVTLIKIKRERNIRKLVMATWKQTFKTYNNETKLQIYRADQLYQFHKKKAFFGVFKQYFKKKEEREDSICRKMDSFTRKVYLDKWKANIKFIKADNYKTDKENQIKVNKFKRMRSYKVVFDVLMKNVFERKRVVKKEEIADDLRNKVKGWLKDFKHKRI